MSNYCKVADYNRMKLHYVIRYSKLHMNAENVAVNAHSMFSVSFF